MPATIFGVVLKGLPHLRSIVSPFRLPSSASTKASLALTPSSKTKVAQAMPANPLPITETSGMNDFPRSAILCKCACDSRHLGNGARASRTQARSPQVTQGHPRVRETSAEPTLWLARGSPLAQLMGAHSRGGGRHWRPIH